MYSVRAVWRQGVGVNVPMQPRSVGGLWVWRVLRVMKSAQVEEFGI